MRSKSESRRARAYSPLDAPSTRGTLHLGDHRMNVCKPLLVGLFLFCVVFVAPPAHSQTASTSCTVSQQAAVECFVANAVATNLTKPRYGMTLAEFESYGFAVSQILQTHRTYLVVVGLSSAIADAMPPTNADGTRNQTAQDDAIMQAITAASHYGFAYPPAGTSLLDLEHFSMDIADAMNNNNGALELLTPASPFASSTPTSSQPPPTARSTGAKLIPASPARLPVTSKPAW